MDVCPNCGAPLPAARPGEIERCTFCAAETRARAERAEQRARGPRSPWARDSWKPPPESSPISVRKTRPPVVFLAVVAGVVAAVGIVIVARGGKSGADASKAPSGAKGKTAGAVANNSNPPPIAVAALAHADLGQWKHLAWTPLDAPPVTGDFSHFDVVANLDWASRIATAWSSDAVLWRVSVQGVQPDGTIHLSTGGTGSGILEFNSKSKGDFDLSIELHPPRELAENAPGSHVNVSIDQHGDRTPRNPLSKPTCLVPRVLAALATPLEEANPTYAVSLDLVVYGATEYWSVGYATGVAQVKGAQAYVNAATCAIEHPK